jgi:hypothetical protein
MMHKIEQELRAATGYTEVLPDRQATLAALAQAVDKMSDTDYDKLTEGAHRWANDAITVCVARNQKRPFPATKTIPEFGPYAGIQARPAAAPQQSAGRKIHDWPSDD